MLFHWDCLDVQVGVAPEYPDSGEIAVAILANDAPDKAALYRALLQAQAKTGQGDLAWGMHFPAYLCLTGLDNPDPLVRDAFRSWFRIRSALYTSNSPLEPLGLGASVTCWAAGVATLHESDPNSETVFRWYQD